MTRPRDEEIFANVSRETRDRLEIYAKLLAKWNPKINLVAASTLPDLWSRHFQDSAQLLEISQKDAESWGDLGSGGGFPGLVIAILARELRPRLRVTCVESDHRKAAFLQTVVRETGLDAGVIVGRIENITPLNADVMSARALAPLSRLLDFAERHLAQGGEALFLKGAGYQKELKEALDRWTFRLDTYPSKTNSDATVLKIGELQRV